MTGRLNTVPTPVPNRGRTASRSRPARSAARGIIALTIALTFGLRGIAAESAGWIVAGDLRDAKIWQSPEYRDRWEPIAGNDAGPQTRLRPVEMPTLFGLKPESAAARVVGGQIDSLSLVMLDAGTYFGFKNGNIQPGTTSTAARDAFDTAYRQIQARLFQGLQQVAGSRAPEPVTLGARSGLGWKAMHYALGGAHARVLAVDHQLLMVDFFPTADAARQLRAGIAATPPSRSTPVDFRKWLVRSDDGGREIRGIPILPQGNRAYCGVATLAMVGQYLGLQPGVEEVAQAAGFRYGELGKADIRELFSSFPREAGVTGRRSPKFEYAKARQSIDAGLPVIVFRRWSPERDYLHTTYTRRRADGEKDATLPLPNMDDRRQWPGKDAPAHASIVHGYNDARHEVIFTESWGEFARSRRMRYEEMEDTSYYAVYYTP